MTVNYGNVIITLWAQMRANPLKFQGSRAPRECNRT